MIKGKQNNDENKVEDMEQKDGSAEKKKAFNLKSLTKLQKVLIVIGLLIVVIFGVWQYKSMQSSYEFVADKMVAKHLGTIVTVESYLDYVLENYSDYMGNETVEKIAFEILDERLAEKTLNNLDLVLATAYQMEQMGHTTETAKEHFDELIYKYGMENLENDRLDYIQDALEWTEEYTYYSDFLDVVTPEMIIENQGPKVEAMIADKDLPSLISYLNRNFDGWEFDTERLNVGDIIDYDEFVDLLADVCVATIWEKNQGGYYDNELDYYRSTTSTTGSVSNTSSTTVKYYGDYKIVSSGSSYTDTVDDEYQDRNNDTLSQYSSSSNDITFQGSFAVPAIVGAFIGSESLSEDNVAIYFYPAWDSNPFYIVTTDKIVSWGFVLDYGNVVEEVGSKDFGAATAFVEEDEEDDEVDDEILGSYSPEELFNMGYAIDLVNNELCEIDEEGNVIESYSVFDEDGEYLQLSWWSDADGNFFYEDMLYRASGEEIDLTLAWIESMKRYDENGEYIEPDISFDSDYLIETVRPTEGDDGNIYFTLYRYLENDIILGVSYVYDEDGQKISEVQNLYDAGGYIIEDQYFFKISQGI